MGSLRRPAIALALTGIFVSASAFAEPTTAERLAARTLFEDGRAALKSGDYGTACPKLEESQRLDPGIGTLYNLGTCYEGQGRVATAWTTFLEVAETARRARELERETAARARAALLEPRIPHLRVTFEGEERRTVTLDGSPFAEGLIGTNVPIDPGSHEVGAEAPGKIRRTTHLEAREGVTFPVSVPLLEDEAVTAIPLVGTPLALAPLERIDAPPENATSTTSSWRTPGAIAAAAAGVVGIGVGSAFGVLAANDWSSAKALGCTQVYCPTKGYPDWQAAHSADIASTASFIVGGVFVATGAVVWFTRPKMMARVGLRSDGRAVLEGRFP